MDDSEGTTIDIGAAAVAETVAGGTAVAGGAVDSVDALLS